MQISFIRHGATAGNLEQRYVGATDEPLTEKAVRELLALRGRYPLPDVVFASPMKRCVQTAGLLFPERGARLCAGLRECAFGAFEYKNYQELQEDRRYQDWIDSGGTLAFPGGESRKEFADRCCAAFELCMQSARGQGLSSAVFVVHGGTIMAILDRYSRPHRDYFDWQTPNAHGFLCELGTPEKMESSGTGEDGYFLERISALPGIVSGTDDFEYQSGMNGFG